MVYNSSVFADQTVKFRMRRLAHYDWLDVVRWLQVFVAVKKAFDAVVKLLAAATEPVNCHSCLPEMLSGIGGNIPAPQLEHR